ncbi:MAG: DUF4111 domain-containing protein [Balneolaceae bacterium]|nr:DUF4111 domain-containing protein [Balneolaceae bacterium]
MEDHLKYTVEVTRRVQMVLNHHLAGMYLYGSLAFDDFSKDQSDLDLLAVTKNELPIQVLQQVQGIISARKLPCLGKALEFSVVTEDAVQQLSPRPAFEMDLMTGNETGDEVQFKATHSDFVLHFEVTRQAGRRLYGPYPNEYFIPQEKEMILKALLAEMEWGKEHLFHSLHDPFGANAVLNGCRCLMFLYHGAMVSKRAGGEWYLLQDRFYFRNLVESALAVRYTDQPRAVDRRSSLDFLSTITAQLHNEMPEKTINH